nr:PREDICTED: taste receptor type 2 member 7-like [Anolis carolinensis]|eukprot:XP_008117505.2 PREDICTED: taste receptor type 2 member 7-like [Anolis carolinensis]
MDNNLISPLGIFRWTMVGSISMVSILGNGFIIVVSGNRWLQNRKMAASDLLLTSLSISRVCLHVTFGLFYVLKVSIGDAYMGTSAYDAIIFACMFSTLASLWCASWLSVFYCVKVTNFANRFLLWLKPRINVLSIRLLGMSVISLVVISVPFFWSYAEEKKRCNLTGSLPVNISKRCQASLFIFHPLHLSVASMNFIITITANVLLIISLWKHTQNLKKSGILAKDLSTQIHITIMKPLVCYILLCLLFFTACVWICTMTRAATRGQHRACDAFFLFFLSLSGAASTEQERNEKRCASGSGL